MLSRNCSKGSETFRREDGAAAVDGCSDMTIQMKPRSALRDGFESVSGGNVGVPTLMQRNADSGAEQIWPRELEPDIGEIHGLPSRVRSELTENR